MEIFLLSKSDCFSRLSNFSICIWCFSFGTYDSVSFYHRIDGRMNITLLFTFFLFINWRKNDIDSWFYFFLLEQKRKIVIFKTIAKNNAQIPNSCYCSRALSFFVIEKKMIFQRLKLFSILCFFFLWNERNFCSKNWWFAFEHLLYYVLFVFIFISINKSEIWNRCFAIVLMATGHHTWYHLRCV